MGRKDCAIKANDLANGFSPTEAVAEIVLMGNPVFQALAHTGSKAVLFHTSLH